MIEIWKDVTESKFSDMYEVSNLGNVRRKEYKVLTKYKSEKEGYRSWNTRVCTQYINKSYNYYPTVLLFDRKKNRHTPRSIHSLVAKAFLTKQPHHQCVNHKDGVKTNNNLENLEWVTTQQNIKHAYDNGLLSLEKAWKRQREVGPVNKKPVYQYTLDGKFIKRFSSIKEAAGFYGGDYWSVSRVCLGERKTYKKHIWRYEPI